MTGRNVWPALTLLAACQAHAACLQLFESVEPHMGTLFRIKLYAESESQAQAAFHLAFDRVAQLEAILSDYKPGSELSRLSTDAIGRAVPASPDLFRVLSAAQAISAESDGAFDVTLGSLTHLWRNARQSGRVPDAKAISDAAKKCGFRKLRIDQSLHTIRLEEKGMLLDVGGIGKGYAAGEAIAVLRKSGVSRALVAASGDLAFSDAPPGKPGWSIGIDSLDQFSQPLIRVLVVKNAAVSTSGDSEQHLDSGGQRYSHVIDPRTGLGLTNRLTVTVIAPNGMQADALTKVVSVWGREKGLAFLARYPGVQAIVVDRAVTPPAAFASEGLP